MNAMQGIKITHKLVFYYADSDDEIGCYGFNCDSDGNVDFSKLETISLFTSDWLRSFNG